VAGRDEAVKALARAFDAQFELTVGDSESPPSRERLPAAQTSGLLFVFQMDSASALAVLPSSGCVPAWCREPDAVQQSRLKTLALELGAVFFSDSLVATNVAVAWVDDLADALTRAELAADGSAVTLTLNCSGHAGALTVIWPAAGMADRILGVAATDAHRDTGTPSEPSGAAGQASGETPSPPGGQPRPRASLRYQDLDEGLRLLPPYSQSLLKIPVPVTVTLAEAKQPLRTILEIGPGSIIHFSKSCEDTLTLEVAGQKFAVGETVKVGDKFGLWITSVVLPDERFWVVGNCRSPVRVK
jgi:flagellar motor switch protein FliN/FliY